MKKIKKGKWKGSRVGDKSGTICSSCGGEKVIYSKMGGYGQVSCSNCVKTATMSSRRRNPRSHFFSTRASTYKMRAKRRGIHFDLSREYIESIAVDVCPVLGLKLNYEYGNAAQSDNSPSLDRINNDEGYVEGNVQWISDLANRMKNSASEEQLVLFAKWVLGS